MEPAQTFVLSGTRSSPTRNKIIEELGVEPHTDDELASILGTDLEQLQKQLDVLRANNLVEAHERFSDTEYVLTDKAPVPLK